MRLHKNIYSILFLAIFYIGFNVNCYAQTSYEIKFLRKFNSLSFAGKVNAFDTLSSSKKLLCYPLIKDELQAIRNQAIIDNQTQIIDKFILIDAEMYYLNKNFTKAIPIYLDFLSKGKIKNALDSAQALYKLKNSYIFLGSLNKAIEIHKTLEELKQKKKDLISNWMMHPKLSELYFEMKLYKECLNQQLLEYNEAKSEPSLEVNYFNNRGLFWSKIGNQDSAIACYNMAKNNFLQYHKNALLTDDDEFTISLIDGNIGQAYIKLNQYAKAIPLLKKDVESSKKVKNTHNAAISLLELSVCYLALNQFDVSKKYIDEAFELMKTIEDTKTQLNILKQYAEYYNKIGQYQLSINYLKKYNQLKDSIEESKNLKELIAFQVASQISEKEKQIKLDQLKINERNIDLNKQKSIRNILIFIFVLIIPILVISRTQLKKANKQKQLLELTNKKIETRNDIIHKSLAEKDLLIKEVHHRVKNNLQIISSLLKLQASKSNNNEVKISLSEAQDRINSMALLHQLLYRNNQMTSLKFDDYLVNLISQFSDSFSNETNQILIQKNILELELDLDTAIPLGLITNELISNAYKHAFKDKNGVIKVELYKVLKNRYCLKIADNGVGLHADFDLNKVDSLGLDIVEILCEQINAELKIYNDDGANFEIHFSKV